MKARKTTANTVRTKSGRAVKNAEKANEVDHTGLYWPEKRSEVERVPLPFQTVETINEPNVNGDKQALLTQRKQSVHLWRNKLIWGDNKYIMASSLPEFAGKINLIYIDPPFASDRKYNFRYKVKLNGSELDKKESIIEELAYRDTWGKGLDSYLQMIYDRLVLMRELLSDNGSIYVHLDWHVGHYVKIIMDEIFGKENFRSEIVWQRTLGHHLASGMDVMTDYILWYSRSATVIYNQQYQLLTDEELKEKFPYIEKETGRRFTHEKLEQASNRYSRGEVRIIQSKKVVSDIGWRWTQETFDQRLRENPFIIFWTSKGKPRYKRYADEYAGRKIGNLWNDIAPLSSGSSERLEYETQKPKALLERIIKSSSQKGDLVADFFCGSGTTGEVAEKLGRRWIMTDLSKFAIHTSRKRLLDITDCKPFEVRNLGKYQKAKMRENGVSHYVDFILKLYRAEPISGYSTIQGKKANRMVHIGHVDSIVTEREIRDTLKECSADGIRSVDFLGWDFEMGLHDLVDRIGDEYSVKVRLVQIPRETLEVKNAAKEKVKFFDLNYLDLQKNLSRKTLRIALKDFVISNPEYLPVEVRESTRKFTEYIDYWAVDFDFNHGGFHNTWQSFRTRRHTALETQCSFDYKKSGDYQVLVKVVDIFGNDTNKLLNVRIPNGKH